MNSEIYKNTNMNMLTFTIDMDSKTPIYRQLYAFIKSEIKAGVITFNTKLPSKRKLSSYLQISQNTVQAAYDQLIEEGYIMSIERKGFFVSEIDNLIQIINSEEHINKSELVYCDNKKLKIIYDFSCDDVDMESFPIKTWRKLTKEAINEYDKEIFQAGESQGHLLLRTSIAEYLHQSRGVKCSADQIIISAGTEFLFQILFQLFDPNMIYGVENPGYEKLNLLFSSNRARFKPIEIDEDGMLPESIIKSNANILCITPAHQFPSGGIMPINRRVQLLNWAYKGDKTNDRYIIEDDYDSEFKYSGKPIPALQGLDYNDKVIYMGNFAKSLSPSIRVSYMVLPVHLVKMYLKKLPFIICPVPVINQKALCTFIQNGSFERHLNRMRNIYKRKREVLVKSIKELNCKIEILGADTGLHLLLQIDNKMTEEELVSSALLNGVKVYGISRYYLDNTYNEKLPRILLGFAAIEESEIKKAILLLKKAWF